MAPLLIIYFIKTFIILNFYISLTSKLKNETQGKPEDLIRSGKKLVLKKHTTPWNRQIVKSLHPPNIALSPLKMILTQTKF